MQNNSLSEPVTAGSNAGAATQAGSCLFLDLADPADRIFTLEAVALWVSRCYVSERKHSTACSILDLKAWQWKAL